MRKYLSFLLTVFIIMGPLSRCAYLDSNLIDGTEAKTVISDRLQLNVIIAGLTGQTTSALITLVTPDLIITDEDATYEKDEVEACADQAFFTALFVSVALSPFVCEIGEYSIQIPILTQKL